MKISKNKNRPTTGAFQDWIAHARRELASHMKAQMRANALQVLQILERERYCYNHRHGYQTRPVSIDEIASIAGMTARSIRRIIANLERIGFIKREYRKLRGIAGRFQKNQFNRYHFTGFKSWLRDRLFGDRNDSHRPDTKDRLKRQIKDIKTIQSEKSHGLPAKRGQSTSEDWIFWRQLANLYAPKSMSFSLLLDLFRKQLDHDQIDPRSREIPAKFIEYCKELAS